MLKSVHEGLPSRLLALVLAYGYLCRLSIGNIEEGLSLVEKEILLGILFLIPFAFWAEYQTLQRRVFLLLGSKLFLKSFNVGGNLIPPAGSW